MLPGGALATFSAALSIFTIRVLFRDGQKKLLIDFDGFDLLYSVVEPLERELGRDYDKTRFEKLRQLRPSREGLTQLLSIDWDIRDP